MDREEKRREELTELLTQREEINDRIRTIRAVDWSRRHKPQETAERRRLRKQIGLLAARLHSLGVPQTEIGQMLGVTRERARQIVAQAREDNKTESN